MGEHTRSSPLARIQRLHVRLASVRARVTDCDLGVRLCRALAPCVWQAERLDRYLCPLCLWPFGRPKKFVGHKASALSFAGAKMAPPQMAPSRSVVYRDDDGGGDDDDDDDDGLVDENDDDDED